LRLVIDMSPRWRIRMEGMCGHIQRGAFADLRLGRRRENQIDFKVLQPMERLRNQMKRTAGFVVCNRGMVIDRELTGQVRGKNSMDCPPMLVIFSPMAMISFWVGMDQWRGEHP
jgi:hypothetical protein